MQHRDDDGAILPSGWEDVLDAIQSALGRSLEVTEGQLRAAAAPPVSVAPLNLARLVDSLEKLQRCLERAERCAGAADSALAAEQELNRRRLETIESLGQRLADWESASV
jgi:hypothetical protein